METYFYICAMVSIEKFKVIFYKDALEFLQRVESKTREKIVYNIDKARYTLDPKLFKKLTGTDIWEFRTLYKGKQYRLLAFWDKDVDVKKTDKTPIKEVARAKEIMKEYFEQK